MINAMRSVSRFLPRAATITILGMHTVFAQQIEEVVVTATKRETTLQETPLSVTAFSRFELQRSGATGIFDYGTKVPNLGFSNEADGRFNSGSPAIRGVASGGVIGATGFYLDDIPVPEYMDPRVIDLERVEILRGPQGTLYGAQSMGGTVRLVTTPADRETSVVDTHAKVSGTNNGGLNWAVDASVNVPIIEGILGVRGSLFYVEESGYFDRAILPTSPGPSFGKIDDVNEDVTYGGQIDLTWKVGSNLEIRPRFMYQRTEADGMPLADIDPDNFVNNRNFNIDEDGENEWWLAAVTFNLDTTIGTIVSTTAKFNREVFESEDGTEFWPAVFGFPAVPWRFRGGEDDESVVHETRLVSDYGELGWDRLAATVGVFYENRTHIRFFPESFLSGLNQNFTALLNAGGAGIPFPPGALGSDLVFSNRDDTDTEQVALFGELTFKLAEWLRFTAGARWSDTSVEFDSISDGFVVGGPSDPPLAKQSESSINPKFLIEADLSDDILVYGSAAKGFRVGGNNLPVPLVLCAGELAALGITNDDIKSFDSDKLWSYELGIKSSWFENRLYLNVAGFYIDWMDILQTNRLACGFQFTANSGEAENKGVEITVDAVPFEGLRVSAGLGLTDAKFSEGSTLAGTKKGDRILQVPEVTFNILGEYTFPMRVADWNAYIRVEFSHYGDSLSGNNAALIPRVRPSFELLNLRLGVFATDRWDITTFFDNVTNERANLSDSRSLAAETPGRPRILTNRPRTIGLEFRRTF